MRKYEDAVRVTVRNIILESLPANSEDAEDAEGFSGLSRELRKGALPFQHDGLDGLGYNTLSWPPDPVDAGSRLRRVRVPMLSAA